MVPLDATATPPRRYAAEVTASEIVYRGRSYRRGDHIDITGQDVDVLREAGVIGAIKRLSTAVEMAVVEPPEDASRNYRRRGR